MDDDPAWTTQQLLQVVYKIKQNIYTFMKYFFFKYFIKNINNFLFLNG